MFEKLLNRPKKAYNKNNQLWKKRNGTINSWWKSIISWTQYLLCMQERI